MDEKDVLEAVRKIRPTVYKYNDKIEGLNDNREHFGFIAQELDVIFPRSQYGIVEVDEDYGFAKVNYHEIIPLLVKYIHHLEERVSKLENVRKE